MHSPSNGDELAGVVGYFDDPESILDGMKKVRKANFESFDAFTPFPIHGMDDAQGLKRSPIPWVTFCAGITGTTLAFALQYWTSVIDWPLNVGGKPFNSWPAFVPVMFELTILFAGISTFLSILIFCRLPNLNRKAFDSTITNNRFAIMIDSLKRPNNKGGFTAFSESEATRVLQEAGAKDVRKVYAEGWF